MTVQTVLVVDDNNTDAWIARRKLEHAGFACLHAETAEQAFELIAAARPDLVVMDLGLPGMDGIEAIRRLRATEVTRSLPVIAITSFRADFPEKEAKRFGADAYIEKPNAYRTLVDAVRELLPPPQDRNKRTP
jgi:CheY-like chemotaxis protein